MNSEPSSAEGLYRGRLAPSPTGYLHVGHARTFWTAYERARDANGTLVMRVEDLDTQRSRPAFAEAAIEDLRWLGIRWQEGPDEGGPYGPYMQSQRQPFYLDAWHRLLRLGLIYPCRCSRKDLEAALAAPHERNSTEGGAAISDEDEEPIYPGTCRPGARREYSSNIALAEESAALQFDLPEGLSWRFALQEGEKVDFEDRNLGPQRYVAGRDFGDFVVWRRDGVPSYQLACVVDDAAMRITEVVRGADLLKSTARQILLNRALGYENPHWCHCPLAVNRYGIRLAKRHDSLSLRALRQRGLTPTEALSVEMLAEP